mmetsp:Transcript_5264/g.7367  ORF Transcript_5264/g.7367 Transcript_5264/m.7367 type:complete len:83 (-) Transcript_5264:59-307(-)
MQETRKKNISQEQLKGSSHQRRQPSNSPAGLSSCVPDSTTDQLARSTTKENLVCFTLVGCGTWTNDLGRAQRLSEGQSYKSD